MSFNRISWTAALLCGAVAFAGNAMAQSGATPQARVTQTTTSPAAPQPRFDIWADGTVRPTRPTLRHSTSGRTARCGPALPIRRGSPRQERPDAAGNRLFIYAFPA